MLKWLVRIATERERQATLLDALDTRVRQLERERTDLQIEHAERIDKLEALLKRMSVRAQRAEQSAQQALQLPEAPDRPQPSVLTFRRDLTARRGI